MNVSPFEVYKFLMQTHFIHPTSQVCNECQIHEQAELDPLCHTPYLT